MILKLLLMCALFLSLTWNAWQGLRCHELREQRDDAVRRSVDMADLRASSRASHSHSHNSVVSGCPGPHTCQSGCVGRCTR